MLALQVVAQGSRLEKRTVERPQAASGQVVIRVRAAGICRSDVHYIDHVERIGPLPHTLGHEISGEIVQVGAGVDACRVGERVCVHYLLYCQRCEQCTQGHEQFCSAPPAATLGNVVGACGMIGKDVAGGYQEYVAVPSVNAIAIPDALPFDQAAIMCCSTATSLHALHKARVRAGESVAIVGTGGLGASAIQLARNLFGASRVFAIDILDDKLAFAERLGAIGINSTKVDVVQGIKAANDNRGVDVVLELVGNTNATLAAIQALAPRGRIVFVGIGYTQNLAQVGVYKDILARELELIGCSDHLHTELEHLARLMDPTQRTAGEQGVLDLACAITNRVPFSDVAAINEALDGLRQGTSNVRSVIVFD